MLWPSELSALPGGAPNVGRAPKLPPEQVIYMSWPPDKRGQLRARRIAICCTVAAKSRVARSPASRVESSLGLPRLEDSGTRPNGTQAADRCAPTKIALPLGSRAVRWTTERGADVAPRGHARFYRTRKHGPASPLLSRLVRSISIAGLTTAPASSCVSGSLTRDAAVPREARRIGRKPRPGGAHVHVRQRRPQIAGPRLQLLDEP
jgi:hypothetical protein